VLDRIVDETGAITLRARLLVKAILQQAILQQAPWTFGAPRSMKIGVG
jgi:hypothetical protein